MMGKEENQNPSKQAYLLSDDLRAAVDAALKLGLPLLITGEPGTGKTRLAHHIAQVRNAQLLVFNTKTSSKAKDLLYKYNALTHFRDSQSAKGEKANPMQYIRFAGLGKAILDAPRQQSVVLIDEIDKAPRDFPNDVLFEFDQLAFEVEEASPEELRDWAAKQSPEVYIDEQDFIRFQGGSTQRPILILTSNSEKNLPDAFLRRCAYYHIPFPERKLLIDIVNHNRPLPENVTQKMRDDAIDHFIQIRDYGLRKKPATAELLAWMDLLEDHGIDIKAGIQGDDDEVRQQIERSYILLGKNKEDRERMISELNR